MGEVLYNKTGASLALVDNEMSNLSVKDFESIDWTNERVREYMDDYLTCFLSVEYNERIFQRVYEEYFKDIDWVKPIDIFIRISYNKETDVIEFSANAERFITSENIKHAYVESHNLTGEKGTILKKNIIEQAEKSNDKVSFKGRSTVERE